MTQTELKKAVAQKAGRSIASVERYLEALRDVTLDELQKGGEVPLPGLGKLFVKQRAERTGRNPRTGETITIPACTVPYFKAFKPLMDAIKG